MMNIDLTTLHLMYHESMDEIIDLVSSYVPNLFGSLLILIVGWLVAILISSLIGSVVSKTKLDDLIAKSIGDESSVKHNTFTAKIKTLVFYLIMLLTLVAFFQALGLTLITEPLNQMLNQIFSYAPRILGAFVLLVTVWVLASLAKKLLASVLEAAKLDEKLATKTGKKDGVIHIAKSISETVYWLILLLILPSILNTLGLTDILGPLNNMFNELLGTLPNIFSAVVILLVGWFLARVVQRVVSNLLVSVGADNLINNMGLSGVFGTSKLSELLGLVTYVFILFPVLISALDALALDAVVGPATNMLNNIFAAVPMILAALIMLGIAVFVGRFASTLVTNLLESIGFNNLMSWLGISHGETGSNITTPSQIVGKLTLAAIILFAGVEAFSMLGMHTISSMLSQFIEFASQILFGIVVLAIGLVLSNLAAKTISSTASANAELLSTVARVAVLILGTAMGLRVMGFANEIINMAFGILFGAVAIAIALAFGLGCKDIAAKETEKWLKTLK